MKKTVKQNLALFLALCMLTGLPACRKEEKETETEQPPLDVPVQTETETETETAPETEAETEPETAPETEPTLPDEAEKLEDPLSDIQGYSDDPNREEEKNAGNPSMDVPADKPAEEPERIYDYLTGRTVTAEEQKRRPAAIMINNIEQSLPQIGIGDGDLYYECAAEGGITRIMMLVSDYEKLGTVGSVRSSRDYFVDFLANHDALYIHAGGSAQAYEKIAWRGINNLDGVNMYTPKTFWRDQDRWNNMGMEHSLMTSGEGIAEGIACMDYRTELDPNQKPLFRFYDETEDHKLIGSPAPHVRMQSTPIQSVDFVYNEETGEYLRYQYGGQPHIDGATGEQISVKNVLILFTDIALIPGDDAGRLTVGTVGSGQGYYITNGKRKVVNWSRDSKTTTMELEYRNGDELFLNVGKTFICIVDNSVARKIDFEAAW